MNFVRSFSKCFRDTSVSAIAASFIVGEFQQLRIYHLIRFLQHLYKIISLVGIVRCEEGIGRAGFLSAAGTTDTMDIILRTGGVVKIDDKLDVFNV